MRSVDQNEIRFVLVPPGALFPDYTIEIDEQHVDGLGLTSADDVLVLAIVTLGQPPTANLLGPLVVNRRTRAAAQVVQVQSRYRAAEPLAPGSLA
jgi:flagellar assembly factor FliW